MKPQKRLIEDIGPADVLRFWLGACPPDTQAMKAVRPQWFQKKKSFDDEIRNRFGTVIEAAAQGQLQDWARDAEGRLALIIVLDQFRRNVYRNDPRSYSADPMALELALEGIELGHDQAVAPMARAFFYLPLEHAENIAMQERSVQLFTALLDDPAAQDVRDYLEQSLDYAHRHHEVIAKFGRFPHRNAALNRESGAAERDYLAQPGAGF